MNEIAAIFHADALRSFRNYKKMAERAIGQLTDEQFFAVIDPESNSAAVMIKHIAGNLHSRWRDFLTTDGEKPDRARDSEFELTTEDTRDALMKFWESGWQTLFDAVEPLTKDDLVKTITIRGEPFRVVEAIGRQLTHYTYHIGQIVFLCKHLRSADWQTLSVPRNRSDDYNNFLRDKVNAGQPLSDATEAAIEFNAGLKQ